MDLTTIQLVHRLEARRALGEARNALITLAESLPQGDQRRRVFELAGETQNTIDDVTAVLPLPL